MLSKQKKEHFGLLRLNNDLLAGIHAIPIKKAELHLKLKNFSVAKKRPILQAGCLIF